MFSLFFTYPSEFVYIVYIVPRNLLKYVNNVLFSVMMFPVSRILEMRLFTDPKEGDYYKSVSAVSNTRHTRPVWTVLDSADW